MRHQQQLLAKRRHRHEIRLVDRQRQQAGVDPSGADFFDRPVGDRHRQARLEVRVHAPQMLQQRRKDVEADGHAARQAKRAAQLARAIGNRPDRFPDILKHALPELDEALGRGGHANLPSDAQEQRLAQLLFEQQNLAADRRLRHVQLAAAGRERPGLGNRLQNLKLTQVHAAILLFYPAPWKHKSWPKSTEHAHGKTGRAIGLTMAVVAALLASVTLMGHRLHTEETVQQTKAADGWAFFQAKNSRYHMYAADAKLAELIGPQGASVAKEWRMKAEEEKRDADGIRSRERKARRGNARHRPARDVLRRVGDLSGNRDRAVLDCAADGESALLEDFLRRDGAWRGDRGVSDSCGEARPPHRPSRPPCLSVSAPPHGRS